MKNKKHYTREESTLLQEIVRTYRYPDGTLNGIAVLSNYWFKIPSPVTLTAEEDQFILIESDYVLRF